MKQKDIALIVLIAGIAAVASYFLSSTLFASGAKRQQETEVVDKITTDFTQPDSKYFSPASIDPTQIIKIGDGKNNNPFNGTAQ